MQKILKRIYEDSVEYKHINTNNIVNIQIKPISVTYSDVTITYKIGGETKDILITFCNLAIVLDWLNNQENHILEIYKAQIKLIGVN